MRPIKGIQKLNLPEASLLQRYANKATHYTDCYAVDVEDQVGMEAYILAFYTSPVFKLERLILKLFLSKPSTDKDVIELAKNKRNTFAAWDVEARNDTQLLMYDFSKRTRSWLMIENHQIDEARKTRLYFGSAVVPANGKSGKPKTLGFVFYALMGFHKLYSRILLRSAKSNLRLQH